jgi:hypothetical protein
MLFEEEPLKIIFKFIKRHVYLNGKISCHSSFSYENTMRYRNSDKVSIVMSMP